MELSMNPLIENLEETRLDSNSSMVQFVKKKFGLAVGSPGNFGVLFA